MKTIFWSCVCWLAVAPGGRAVAQTYDTNGVVVQTFAGSGFHGYVDGVGVLSSFNGPGSLVADSQTNLFVWDSYNYRIRRIAPDATVSTFAGGGNQTTGAGTNVVFTGFLAMTIDPSDTIWMVTLGSYLYKITSDATITRTNLALAYPQGICADSAGNIYLADGNANKIYRYASDGTVTVLAGSGNVGSADGNGIFTSFNNPAALAADAANNIYVWDSGNHLIRRIDSGQNVTTLAGSFGDSSSADGLGTNASFSSISQMNLDDFGNLLLACGTSIRAVSATTNVTTVAGSFTQSGYTNGPGNLARFSGAAGICAVRGTVFVADFSNERIRDIVFNQVPQPVSAGYLGLNTYPGLTITGVIGRTYRIESSTDLNAWNPEATILLTSSPYLWIDQNGLGRRKFYRAFLLP